MIAEKKARGRARRGPEALKELGEHRRRRTIKLMSGRFGPYVTDGDVNATVPKDIDPLTVTLEAGGDADRRTRGQGRRQEEEEGGQERLRPRRRQPKAPAKKAAKKAPAKKKAAAKKKRRRPRPRPRPRRKAGETWRGANRAIDTTSLDKARVLEILAANPGATKRDFARQLGLKGADRIALKRILKELEDDGADRARQEDAAMPSPARCRRSPFSKSPARTMTANCWRARSAGTATRTRPRSSSCPAATTAARRSARGETILARLSEASDGAFEARIIKRLGASVHRVLGVYHAGARGQGRIAPIDRKSQIRIRRRCPRRWRRADPTNSSWPNRLSGRASRLAARARDRAAGLMDEPKTVSLIAIHAHGIPTEFPREAHRRSRARQARNRPWTDGFARHPARHHRSRRRARPRRRGVGRPGRRQEQSRRPCRHRRHRRCRPLRDARLGARSRKPTSAATPPISPTASCPCCRTRCRAICARCTKTWTGPAWPCAWCSMPRARSGATNSCAG